MRWLSIDPGETTGWALWKDDELVEAGQTPGWEFADELGYSLEIVGPPPSGMAPRLYTGVELVVIEDFALYPWSAQDLAWDKLRTVRIIGAIQWICREAGIRLEFQPAKIKEQAKALGAEEHFETPLHENRHQNDAIMHGVVWLAKERSGAAA